MPMHWRKVMGNKVECSLSPTVRPFPTQFLTRIEIELFKDVITISPNDRNGYLPTQS